MSKFVVEIRVTEMRGRYDAIERKSFSNIYEAEDYMQSVIEAIESVYEVSHSDECADGAWLIEYDPKMQTTLRIVAA